MELKVEEKTFYKTRDGDRLSAICEELKVPLSIVSFENRLSGDELYGQVLFVPRMEGEVYRVKAGDTLLSISEKFCVTVESIKSVNHISYVYPSQLILIHKSGK